MRFLLSKLKEKYLSCQFLRLFIFSILVILLVALFKYVVFANEINVSDIPSCSATIDDESNISSSNPTGERSATLDVSSFGNNKVFNSNSDIKTTNFLFRLNFVDSGKNHSEFRIITLISAQNNDVVLENGKNQSGENFICYQDLINPSSINYNGNTKVKKTSNIAYYVTFDNLSTYNTDMMNYLRNYASTGEFSEATIDISNRTWDSDGEPIDSGAPIRDIETPQNVKVLHTKNMDRWDFRINWDVPEMNNHHYYVRVEVADYLKFKKFAWQSYHNFTVGWHFATKEAECSQGYYIYKIDEDVACHQGLANAWKKEYGGDKMSLSKAKSYFNMEGSLLGASKHDFVKKWKYPGITIQFWYRDENGRMHTSNYVQLTDLGECDGYVANELSKFDYLNDGNSGEIADNDKNVINKVVDNSSGNYDGSSDVMHDNNEDIEEKSAIEILKSMMRDLKNYPDFFVEFFSFLPGQISQYLYALIIVMIPLVLLKIVRG